MSDEPCPACGCPWPNHDHGTPTPPEERMPKPHSAGDLAWIRAMGAILAQMHTTAEAGAVAHYLHIWEKQLSEDLAWS